MIRILALALCFINTALPADWYLSASATGLNNGTSIANAWQTVAAINLSSVQAGDTLYINGGDYSTEVLGLSPASSRDNISFRIYPGATQQAVFLAIELYDADGGTLDGLLGASQMIKTVGLTASTPRSSILVRESAVFTIKGVECTQLGVASGGVERHGIAINGNVQQGTITQNYVHDIIADCININNSAAPPPAGDYSWFAITNNTLLRPGDDGIQLAFGGATVSGNTITQGGATLFPGSHPDGIQLNPDNGALRFYGNTVTGFTQCVFVEYVTGADDIQIYNNVLIGSVPDPIGSVAGYTSRALNYSSRPAFTGTLMFANNTVHNFRYFFACNGGVDGGTPLFRNNIFLDCKFAMSDATTAAYLDATNSFYSTPGIQYYDTAGNPASTPANQFYGGATVGDPKMTGEYRLQAGSAAIGIGTALSTSYTTDLLGLTRSVPWDAGAYKYVSSGFTPAARIRNPASFAGAASN